MVNKFDVFEMKMVTDCTNKDEKSGFFSSSFILTISDAYYVPPNIEKTNSSINNQLSCL